MKKKLDRPIFIIGCGKSGTTLLAQLMLFHPDLAPKLPGFDHCTNQERLDLLLTKNGFDCSANLIEKKAMWDSYFKMNATLRIGKELILYKNPLNQNKTEEFKVKLAEGVGEARLLSKQPFNSFRIHVLREIFPDCKIVAIHRDGRDVVASWGDNKAHGWSVFGGVESAINVYARKWNETIDHIENFREELGIHVLRYESLIASPVDELKKIFDYCDLRWFDVGYENLALAGNVGKWVERIPIQYHSLVESLTKKNLRRIDSLGSVRVGPSREVVSPANESSGSFIEFYNNAKKRLFECDLCGGRDLFTITYENRHSVRLPTAICKECALVQINPRPDKSWYDIFYKKWFWGLYVGSDKTLAKLYVDDEQDYKGSALGQVIKKLEDINDSSKQYLDIGCGLGGLVHYVSDNTRWQVSAVDTSIAAVDFVKDRCPEVEVFCQPVDDIKFDKMFDFISMVHVLEHAASPVKLLQKINSLLKLGGTAYIEVPDVMSSAWKNRYFFHIAHTYNFSPSTFRLACEKSGLVVEDSFISPVKSWAWARGFVVRKGPRGMSSLSGEDREDFEKVVKHIKRKIDESESRFQFGPGFMGPKTIQRYIVHLAKKVFEVFFRWVSVLF